MSEQPTDPSTPTPEQTPEQLAQAKRDAAHRPRVLTFVVGAIVMYFLESFTTDRAQWAGRLQSYLLTQLVAGAFGWLLFSLFLRFAFRISTKVAFLYAAMLCMGMYFGEMLFALRFLR